MPAPARTLVLLNSRYPVQRHTIPLWPASYFRHLRNATMKLKHSTALAMACLWLGFTPAWAVNKDIVQLQTQMQDLQQQMSRMQQSFDERMGIMKNLLDQNTDSINKATSAISNIQNGLQKQQSDSGSHVDQLSGQIQSLNDTLDELKARLTKVSKQLEDMQSTQQNMAAQQSQQQQQAQVPPPDVLYNNALRDYQAGKNDLAVQEFGDYVKNYPNTDLAGNCYFYLADIQFKQGNYQQAVKTYDQLLVRFATTSRRSRLT